MSFDHGAGIALAVLTVITAPLMYSLSTTLSLSLSFSLSLSLSLYHSTSLSLSLSLPPSLPLSLSPLSPLFVSFDTYQSIFFLTILRNFCRSLIMPYVLERAKNVIRLSSVFKRFLLSLKICFAFKVLDFVCTLYFWHLVFCYFYQVPSFRYKY